MLKRLICLSVLLTFTASVICPSTYVHAAPLLGLPEPGKMVSLSGSYSPTLIKGISLDSKDPFRFNFIVDAGDDYGHSEPKAKNLKSESTKLIKYFLAALTIPEKDMWVNLSPYEKDRMLPSALSQTEMGRDMLAQDYILKQLTASLIYPEKDLGKKFWNKVYAKAQALYGNTQIPVNTFNKVWIVADKADVFERGQSAFIINAHLKVMLEEDYLAASKQLPLAPSLEKRGEEAESPLFTKEGIKGSSTLASQIIREIVLPELESEVNQGQNFAPLRQMFYSMILASWFKLALKDAVITQLYGNQSKVQVGVNAKDLSQARQIYERYIEAYKKGVFNYIKEDSLSALASPRKYFSGGLRVIPDTSLIGRRTGPDAALEAAQNLTSGHSIFSVDTAMSAAATSAIFEIPQQVSITNEEVAWFHNGNIFRETLRFKRGLGWKGFDRKSYGSLITDAESARLQSLILFREYIEKTFDPLEMLFYVRQLKKIQLGGDAVIAARPNPYQGLVDELGTVIDFLQSIVGDSLKIEVTAEGSHIRMPSDAKQYQTFQTALQALDVFLQHKDVGMTGEPSINAGGVPQLIDFEKRNAIIQVIRDYQERENPVSSQDQILNQIAGSLYSADSGSKFVKAAVWQGMWRWQLASIRQFIQGLKLSQTPTADLSPQERRAFAKLLNKAIPLTTVTDKQEVKRIDAFLEKLKSAIHTVGALFEAIATDLAPFENIVTAIEKADQAITTKEVIGSAQALPVGGVGRGDKAMEASNPKSEKAVVRADDDPVVNPMDLAAKNLISMLETPQTIKYPSPSGGNSRYKLVLIQMQHNAAEQQLIGMIENNFGVKFEGPRYLVPTFADMFEGALKGKAKEIVKWLEAKKYAVAPKLTVLKKPAALPLPKSTTAPMGRLKDDKSMITDEESRPEATQKDLEVQGAMEHDPSKILIVRKDYNSSDHKAFVSVHVVNPYNNEEFKITRPLAEHPSTTLHLIELKVKKLSQVGDLNVSEETVADAIKAVDAAMKAASKESEMYLQDFYQYLHPAVVGSIQFKRENDTSPEFILNKPISEIDPDELETVRNINRKSVQTIREAAARLGVTFKGEILIPKKITSNSDIRVLFPQLSKEIKTFCIDRKITTIKQFTQWTPFQLKEYFSKPLIDATRRILAAQGFPMANNVTASTHDQGSLRKAIREGIFLKEHNELKKWSDAQGLDKVRMIGGYDRISLLLGSQWKEIGSIYSVSVQVKRTLESFSNPIDDQIRSKLMALKKPAMAIIEYTDGSKNIVLFDSAMDAKPQGPGMTVDAEKNTVIFRNTTEPDQDHGLPVDRTLRMIDQTIKTLKETFLFKNQEGNAELVFFERLSEHLGLNESKVYTYPLIIDEAVSRLSQTKKIKFKRGMIGVGDGDGGDSHISLGLVEEYSDARREELLKESATELAGILIKMKRDIESQVAHKQRSEYTYSGKVLRSDVYWRSLDNEQIRIKLEDGSIALVDMNQIIEIEYEGKKLSRPDGSPAPIGQLSPFFDRYGLPHVGREIKIKTLELPHYQLPEEVQGELKRYIKDSWASELQRRSVPLLMSGEEGSILRDAWRRFAHKGVTKADVENVYRVITQEPKGTNQLTEHILTNGNVMSLDAQGEAALKVIEKEGAPIGLSAPMVLELTGALLGQEIKNLDLAGWYQARHISNRSQALSSDIILSRGTEAMNPSQWISYIADSLKSNPDNLVFNLYRFGIRTINGRAYVLAQGKFTDHHERAPGTEYIVVQNGVKRSVSIEDKGEGEAVFINGKKISQHGTYDIVVGFGDMVIIFSPNLDQEAGKQQIQVFLVKDKKILRLKGTDQLSEFLDDPAQGFEKSNALASSYFLQDSPEQVEVIYHFDGDEGAPWFLRLKCGELQRKLVGAEESQFEEIADLAMEAHGGIDLNGSNMGLKVSKDQEEGGVKVNFDQSQIARMKQGFNGFVPVILNITPITNIRPILGLSPRREEEEKLAGNVSVQG